MTELSRRLFWVKLSPKHSQVEFPRFRLSKLSAPPAAMHIERQVSGTVRVIYNDATGVELTAQDHPSLDRAFGAAEFEFGVQPTDWIAENAAA